MGWQIDLIGDETDVADIDALTKASALGDIAIVDGPDGRKCLAGPRFAAYDTAEKAQAEAGNVLETLNGLARFQHANHRPVTLAGTASCLHPDGRIDRAIVVRSAEVRVRAGLAMTVIRANGSTEQIASSDGDMDCAQRIAGDPRLVEIVNIFAGDITWQRMRVAFEKITALIGRSGKDSQALWQKGYATREEIESFKANAEDPRLSGNDAVHGVPDGRPKGTKMGTDAGVAFITRLLHTYLDQDSG